MHVIGTCTMYMFFRQLELFSPKFWLPAVIEELCFEAQIQEVSYLSKTLFKFTFNFILKGFFQHKTNRVVVADSTKEEWLYIVLSVGGRSIDL